MKKLSIFSKRVTSLILVLALIISYFIPISSLAISSTNKLTISFRKDEPNNINHADYGIAQYSLNNGESWTDVTNDISNIDVAVTGDNLRIRIVPNDGYYIDYNWIMLQLGDDEEIHISNEDGFESNMGYSVPANKASAVLRDIEFRKGDGVGQGQPSVNNETGKVRVHIIGEELEYNNPWSEDAADFIFGINGSEMKRLSKDEVNYTIENNKIIGLETKNEINYDYNYNDSGTVTFNVRTQWDDVITSLKINNVLYDTPQTKKALIEAFSERGIKFDISNVPYAETYNIEVIGRKQTDEEKIMGNFGWTYDPNTNEYSDDDKIPYGNLEFVKAVYNNVIYNSIKDVNAAGGTFEWNDGVKGTNDPTGEAMFPTGTELTLRLIPDSGYQLTALTLNGTPFETGEEIGVYTFTIQGGNWHLGANFTEVDNEVVSESVNVKNGKIDIDIANDNSFTNGTAKLEVNDIISMSPNRVEQFETTAIDKGYEIENYLDISLFNSIYKGGLKDANGNYESWDTPVASLEDKAAITLELENDMNGKDLVVVHEKHEGNTITGYEIIDTIYNKENNTITFETDSFSNYAIASKEKTETERYVLTSGDATFIFTDEANHDFEVTFMDVLNLTDEQLELLGITKKEFVQILNTIKENTSKFGMLLSVYAIDIEDTNRTYTGKTEIKIKMTDEMKKFNSFKFVHLDEDNNFKVGDIVDCKIEGDCIIGTLPHLSAYALVGSNVEITPSTENTTSKTNNPKTGDNIAIWIGLMLVSMVGIAGTAEILKINK